MGCADDTTVESTPHLFLSPMNSHLGIVVISRKFKTLHGSNDISANLSRIVPSLPFSAKSGMVSYNPRSICRWKLRL